MFRDCVKGVLEKLLKEGKNALIFTYGVTNAGKSFTLVGDKKNPGILPNTMTWLLQMKKKLIRKGIENQCINVSQTEFLESNYIDLDQLFYNNTGILSDQNSENWIFKNLEIKISCFEIYNDEIHDLFCKKGMKQKAKKLQIKEINKKLIIENLKIKTIESIQDFENILNKCLKNRSILQTALNKSSSRSHCIFKIFLDFYLDSDEEQIKIEKSITLVDLAGSERAKRTDNIGQKLKEANKINQSLSCLGRCLRAMSEKKIAPFRETKLTRYLSDFFIEDNNIIMIANINPRLQDFEESINALNYTAMAREIKTLPSRFSMSMTKIQKSKIKKNYSDKKINFESDDEKCKRQQSSSRNNVVVNFETEQIKSMLNIIMKNVQENNLAIQKLQKIIMMEQMTRVSNTLQSPHNNQKKKNKKNGQKSIKNSYQKKINQNASLFGFEDSIFDNHEQYQNISSQQLIQFIEKKEKSEQKLRVNLFNKIIERDDGNFENSKKLFLIKDVDSKLTQKNNQFFLRIFQQNNFIKYFNKQNILQ